jgi:ATP-dependent Lon protease
MEAPGFRDLRLIGTVASVLRVTRASRDTETRIVFVEGRQRIRLLTPVQARPYLIARAERIAEARPTPTPELGALMRGVRELFFDAVKEAPNLPDEVMSLVAKIDEPGPLADFVAQSLPSLSTEARQTLLEMLDPAARLRRLTEELVKLGEEQRIGQKIRDEVKEKISGRQREMLLREQLQAIRRELGEGEEGAGELAELRDRLDAAGLSEEARQQADRELARLESIPMMSPEYTVARNYLDWLANLPWKSAEGEAVDIGEARRVLDEDHYGLEKVKERILEYLAVFQLKPDIKAPILCFVGPPGVGKTSVGRSIARAMGRKFVRASLGGMHDEAEIRGHRRTYIGALPGQIIQSLWRAAVNNPVFMLDEVDKLGRDFRGDPAAALLEVLDPEQNHAFRDRYLDVAFDLSKVVFTTTANYLDPIPPPLLDRMEVLELPGYVDDEKLEIAKRYLVPKQARENGLELGEDISFTEEGLRAIMHGYTHEAGVRLLEQKVASVCRKRAKLMLEHGRGPYEVNLERVRQLLGAPRYRVETEIEERTRKPGVAIALAWTPAGGEILFVEASRMARDKGELSITGSVRQVMEESVRAALSWLRANIARYGVEPSVFRDYDIHVHVPAGAVPKDGPSAGVVMVAALASLFFERPVRPRVGLTGEITLSGLVLPVGGIKEKVLAAKRSGIREVILPERNRPDVEEEIPEALREGLGFHYVGDLDAALSLAFEEPRERISEEPAGPDGREPPQPHP